ncbi:anthranilate synthase component I family protein [Microbacterium sp. NPDC091313]
MSDVTVPLPSGVSAEHAFAVLDAAEEHVFWLDAGPSARTGWSFVGVGTPEPDPSAVRAVRLGPLRRTRPRVPFGGGWVGWMGYEAGAAAAGAPVHPAADGVPMQRWLRVDAVVAFSHADRTAQVVGEPDAAAALAARLRTARPPSASPPIEEGRASREALARHAPDQYAAMIEACRRRIGEGDAYQLCLTTRFTVPGPMHPRATYERLRAASPSHHGALIRSGSVALASSSPERFLEISDGVVRTHPIKGTRRRSADAAVDAALVDELRADPKERAENVMIVDLMRNDLSRIGRPGSVEVERLLEVETYPSAHQLVSTVSVASAPGTTVGDVLDATFPAGSMTGAPKLSAMTILHALEQAPRGLFAGCFGWVGHDGAADLAMVIRSIVTTPEGAYVGAGGGITWLSHPPSEVAEVALKARAPLRSLGALLPPDWRV